MDYTTPATIFLIILIIALGVYNYIIFKHPQNKNEHNYIVDFNGIHPKQYYKDQNCIYSTPSEISLYHRKQTKKILQKAADEYTRIHCKNNDTGFDNLFIDE